MSLDLHALDLERDGIHAGRVHWNLSAAALYEEAIRRNEGVIAVEGPLACRTGQHTGRSPNDKFVVREPSSENDIEWGKVNRLLKERGVKLTDGGTKEMDGKKCQVLHLSFEQVGLTPKDQYNLYLDPESGLVTSWDYMPEPGKTEHMTWSDYQKSGGLTLATNHSMDNGATKIRMENLKVTTVK